MINSSEAEIIIIGAGASGLMAGWEMVQAGKNVIILEAANRPGGRINTILEKGFEIQVENGAEFIHGKLEYTLNLLKRAGIKHYKVAGEIWKYKNGVLEKQDDFIEGFSELNKKFRELKHDISVKEFMEQCLPEEKFKNVRFTLKRYINGYYAAKTSKASTFALFRELNTSDDIQYRVEGGYFNMIDYMVRKMEEKGGMIHYNREVNELDWNNRRIVIKTKTQSYSCERALVTVPIGVLRSEKIKFRPAVPDKITAAKQLGYGPVVKTILQFENPFWQNKETSRNKDLSKLGFIFSETDIPTWWTQYPKITAVLTGWSGGPDAEKLKGLTKDDILQRAIQSLSQIFSIEPIRLNQMLKASVIGDWMEGPLSLGAYSYDVVNGEGYKSIVRAPLDNRIYFAGEGLYDGSEIGTVEAALITGRDASHAIIASIKS